MQNVAMGWLIYRLTGSTFLLGFIGFTNQIPSFILSPVAGVIIDRQNRQRIMRLTQIFFMIQAALISILVLTDLIQIWQIILLSLVFGFISAFDAPARQSLVIDLIDNPKNPGNAIALNSAMYNGARLIGPAIAGIVIAIVGGGVCFSINALSYTAIILALYKVNISKKTQQRPKESVRKEFTEGFNYTFGNRPIRTLILLLAIFSLFGTPFITLMPAFAAEVLKGGSHIYGFIMSATGAGAFLGAFYLASQKNIDGLGRIISRTAILFGLSLFGFSFAHNLWISMIIGFVAGLSMISAIASANTLIQTITEESKRGRVMSFYAMALMGMNPIGNLIAGSVASGIGISNTIMLSGIITLMVGIWFAFYWRVAGKV
jgi:MFS family permease